MWKSYLASNFKKASENVFMIELEPLWEGKGLTDGQCEQYFTCSLSRLNFSLLSAFISKAIAGSMWTRRPGQPGSPHPCWQTNQFPLSCYQISSLTSRQDSKSSIRSRREGTLQKIGEFLQSSPTLLGTKGQFAAQWLLILKWWPCSFTESFVRHK